ncbi:MAG: hypothetical protein H7145_18625 [Akkermansiaceae bacterium]|nr:hypothetical protein [Armatimonadota bacterium]
MITHKYYGRLFVSFTALTITASLFAGGCAPTPQAQSSQGAKPDSTVTVPKAKPGAKIGENNPAPGQANHMSPEMQAQMQRYQSLGEKK